MNALSARNVRTALFAAVHNRQQSRVNVELLSGRTVDFLIEEVLDDSLIGRRNSPNTSPMIIPYHAILTLEFRP